MFTLLKSYRLLKTSHATLRIKLNLGGKFKYVLKCWSYYINIHFDYQQFY